VCVTRIKYLPVDFITCTRDSILSSHTARLMFRFPGMLLLLTVLAVVNARSVRWQLPLPCDMIALNSTDGTLLMKNPQTLSATFWNGFLHLETQKTQSYCSIATSVTILNALASGVAPVDPIYDPYPYWTQDSYFSDCTNKVVSSSVIYSIGATLDQFGEMLSCYEVKLEVFKANQTTVEVFRDYVKKSMTSGHHIAINFDRKELSESGGGHFSPIMAYNEEKDLVLITGTLLLFWFVYTSDGWHFFADVARYKYPSAWAPVAQLFDSMMTVDSASNDSRGFVVVKPTIPPSLSDI
jgi:hypothetical protein